MTKESPAKAINRGEVESAELRSAEEFVAKLSLAAKNINLYPEHHAIPQKSLRDLRYHLSSFTDQYGDLVIDVYKTHVKYRGHTIAAGTGVQDNLAYLCYRDGIQELTFTDETEEAELWAFVKIINAHRVLEEEKESDIVTDLWEAGLLHIKYSTNNRLWENEPLLDLSRLRVSAQNSEPEIRTEENQAPSILESSNSPQPWELEASEIEATYRMVVEEENREFHRDVFDVLLILLNEQRAKEDFSTVLEIIQECLIKTFSLGQFPRAARFLKNFRRIHQKYKNDGHWAQAYLDDFWLMISSPRVLWALTAYLQEAEASDAESNRGLHQMLLQMPPDIILRLGPMLPQIRLQSVADTLREAMALLAEADIRPLAHLAKNAPSPIATEAIEILCELNHSEADAVLAEASHSPENAIRRMAVFAMARRKSHHYHRFIEFLSDPDDKVRQMAFDYICSRRQKMAEAALIGHLENSEWGRKDTAMLHTVYAALGKCGSKDALLFLKKQLFGKPWRIGRLRAAHRAGAAMAIFRIDDSESDRLFGKARGHFWPPVRRAVRRAMELNNEI